MGYGKAEWMRNLRRWDIRQWYEWDTQTKSYVLDKPYYEFRP